MFGYSKYFIKHPSGTVTECHALNERDAANHVFKHYSLALGEKVTVLNNRSDEKGTIFVLVELFK